MSSEDKLRIKANKIFYFLVKEASRYSFIEFLEDSGSNADEFDQIAKIILEKTGFDINSYFNGVS